MFNLARAKITSAHARKYEIESKYPDIQIGKTEADREKLRSLLMSREHYNEWWAIGVAIGEAEKAL
jgi:hypothetical protein